MRLLIIGLDGATWKVMDPLLDQGRLPNTARLLKSGTRAVLRAFEPILSPVLWTSMATAKMPAKHGVTRYFHTANKVRTKRLWDLLERPDRPIGLWSWPVTWPPRPVNGFMIPSLFARADDTYPADLRFIKELETGLDTGRGRQVQLMGKAMRHGLRPATAARIANYVINQKLGRYNAVDRHIQQRLLKLEIHLDLYTWLVQRYRPFFTSFYLNQTDAFGHAYWRYYEPDLFPDVEAKDVDKYGHVVPMAYEKADRAVGRILRLTDEDTLVVVVSDHGFQAELKKSDRFHSRVLGGNLLRALNLDDVLYVNYRRYVILELPERRPDIAQKLRQLRVRELDQPLLRVEEDPDGRITVNLSVRSSNYQDMTTQDLKSLHVVWPGEERPFLEFIEPHYNQRQSGAHHLEGIAIFSGPGVQRGGHVEDGTILDVVPTVLALLGMPVGRDMDGKVLQGAVSPGYLERTPISYIDTYDTDLERGKAVAEEEPLSQEVRDRLRALGYID